MNPWESISGAICFNVFIHLFEDKPKKIYDLILPLCCTLYLSDHWGQLNFSKTHNIKELRGYVSQDVQTMKDLLLAHPDATKEKVKAHSEHLNGSLAFAVVIVQSLYNGNQNLYKDNLEALFQESWEIIFWFIQDLKDEKTRKVLCDYTEQHKTTFLST